MNYLAHLHLSGTSTGLIIGNFIADSVKGSAINSFSDEIKEGIRLHRNIDTFTDTHPIVEESKQRLREKYKKYASVIVDVFYDHYLASNWIDYSTESLDEYTKNIYSIIEEHKSVLPLKSKMFTEYMLKYNILSAYADLDGIDRVLTGMSKRTRFISNMEHAIFDLKESYPLYENEFKRFYPDLKQFVNTQIEI
jgi:acyl carrier protein phosphodiesterase